MAQNQKLVKVDDDIVAFPGDLEDAHVAKLIKSFRDKRQDVPNAQYAKSGPYKTQLAPEKEAQFQTWVRANNVPWQDTPTADYDMRGYWQAMVSGDKNAKQSLNKNDNKPHYPDTWKTPYHKSFSNESKYARPNAPKWNDKDQLVDSSGKVVFDERAAEQKIKPPSKVTTEESEHARQLKPAQPVGSVVPKLPDWATAPLSSTVQKFQEAHPNLYAPQLKTQKKQEEIASQFREAHPVAGGVVQGVNQFAESMTSPTNMAMMLGAPESKILSAIFATQALRGSYSDAKAAQKAFEEGKNAEAAQYVTQAVLGAGAAGLAGVHAYKGLPEGVRTKLASEEGSVPLTGGKQIPAPFQIVKSEKEVLDAYGNKIPYGPDGRVAIDWDDPKKTTLETVDPKKLKTDQVGLTPSRSESLRLNQAATDTPIHVVRTDSGDFIDDGHHRAAIKLEQGQGVQARVLDVRSNALDKVKTKAAALKPTTAYKTVDQSQPFYLKSEHLVTEKMKGPMPAADVQKMLVSNGVKPEEMQWTGLDDFLWKNWDKKVTPEQIQEHLAGSNLQIQEVQKGGMQHGRELKEPWEIWKASDSGKPVYGVKRDNGLLATEATTGYDSYSLARFLDQHRDTYSVHEGPVPQAEPPKFGSYVLPGGENYREMLITAPSIGKEAPLKPEFKVMTEGKGGSIYTAKVPNGSAYLHHSPGFPWRVDFPGGESMGGFNTPEEAIEAVRNNPRYQFHKETKQYQSPHWKDDPNTLGHIRMNDRTGPNGEKILHIEEMQSDWHQKGRKKGYTGAVTGKTKLVAKEVQPGWYEVSTEDGTFVSNVTGGDATKSPEAAIEEARRRLVEEPRRTGKSEMVPDAPFKKNWHELMLKRMIKYASDHSYDGISWTPGEAQAERYDLSKQVKSIVYNPDKGDLYAVDAHGGGINEGGITPDKLSDYIGKEAAQKILQTPRSAEGNHKLTGVDLKVGGKGMKGFYDKMIPEAANKLAKQWGGKVGETKIEAQPETDRIQISESDGYFSVIDPDDPHGAPLAEFDTQKEADDYVSKLRGDVKSEDHSIKVPYLPLKKGSSMAPFSLFAAAGVALTLPQIRKKADELQGKFKNAGLAQ